VSVGNYDYKRLNEKHTHSRALMFASIRDARFKMPPAYSRVRHMDGFCPNSDLTVDQMAVTPIFELWTTGI